MESKQILYGNKTRFKNISKSDFKKYGTTKDAIEQKQYTIQAQRQQSCFLTAVMLLNSKIKSTRIKALKINEIKNKTAGSLLKGLPTRTAGA